MDHALLDSCGHTRQHRRARSHRRAFDRLIVAGDIVDYGAAPEQTILWLRERGAIAVRGNHDHAMATGADCRSSPLSYGLSVATREHFRPLLSADAMAYLRQLLARLSLDVEDTRFHVVHATPRDPMYEYLSGDAEESAWRLAVGGLADKDEWLFVGHTHRPFIRRVGRLTVVNPGSLGMPIDGDRRACFAVWEDGEVRLERLAYNIELAIERMRSSGLPQEVTARMAKVLQNASRNA